MLKRINVLNFETTNKIAAGEVVERPSSVVKELIENSIDAGANNITIEILEGGMEKIKIVDDGAGIHSEDMKKAFLPHATSKISSIDDVYALNTFGFRGEALASIASVSIINLKSKTVDLEFGKELKNIAGSIENIEEVGCNNGTSIEVNDLFFNIPARKKFLKSPSREGSLISTLISKLALANHKVSFKYYNNNKKSLVTFASEDVKETIKYVYGKTIYDNLIKFENHTDIISVHGYVGTPEISRGSRNNQSIFVNKRLIKSPLITTAVENAFKSFTTVHKYPFFVLFLDIFPEYIDVNVHPTKAEIKFNNDKEIFSAVFNTVHKAIRASYEDNFEIKAEPKTIELLKENNDYINSSHFVEYKEGIANEEEKLKNLVKENIQIPLDLKSLKDEENTFKSPLIDITNVGNEDLDSLKEDKQVNNESRVYNYNDHMEQNDYVDEGKQEINEIKQDILESEQEIKQDRVEDKVDDIIKSQVMKPKFPKIRIIGQFNKTYILGEADNEFYMIDQHAAHEKILFEKFSKDIENRTILSQTIMIPVIIELSPEDFYYYTENSFIFQNAGFNIEPFGDNTLSVREVPIILGKTEVVELFYGILDNIKNYGKGNITAVKAYIINQLACKTAIKANHNLSTLEMDSLIENLRFIDEPFHCPHGRPIIIKMSLYELEKKFKRIV
ncbi:DNA mismatch repair endonuclease MutL [Clostridium grantii]|uniref:DNA mismatch repair protein MutL n=1 Tax=Clostridium grantii DSM 8605 TaxID=1121316 RepID=A0A1M5VPI1_9CLOT|nr:DNA mismatch repair endonuclease MutL [Clostridium grantii]SHH77100.1 DNA mismatch repair protein MutL [Clostridium grantii DSM 8605]